MAVMSRPLAAREILITMSRQSFPQLSLRSNTRNAEFDAIHAGAGGHVKSLGVRIAPVAIGSPLRKIDGAYVLSFRRNDPDAARTRAIKISLFIHLDAVRGADALAGVGLAEYLAIGHRAVGLHVVTHPDHVVGIGNGDVEIFFIRRERNTVGACEVLDQKLKVAIVGRASRLVRGCARQTVNAVERRVLRRIFVALGRQAMRWISKIERTVGFMDQVIGAVQALALIAVAEGGELGARFQRLKAIDIPLRMARNGEAALLIECHAV